jgi:protein-S-isoprenylcysteine O-methyltransferase Ste14
MSAATKKISPTYLIGMLSVVILLPLLPLLISGRWEWWEAWVFAFIQTLGFFISRGLAARRHPDIIAERAGSFQNPAAKPWDRVLAPLVAFGSQVIGLAAGLEMRLEPVAEFSLPLKLAALVLLFLGYGLGAYALIENRFFSGTVRIQNERGHHVVTTGPYAWMRHPGYSGFLFYILVAPIWLDSPWSYLVVGGLAILLVLRTHLEDQTLQAELPGYAEYAQKVRYRLVPGVW